MNDLEPAWRCRRLREFWMQGAWALHSAAWWRRHWERTGLVEVVTSDTIEDGWKLWSQWQREAWPHNTVEIEAVEKDAGRFLTYVRLAGRRRGGMALEEYCWPDTMRSMASTYEKKPMLRE